MTHCVLVERIELCAGPSQGGDEKQGVVSKSVVSGGGVSDLSFEGAARFEENAFVIRAREVADESRGA